MRRCPLALLALALVLGIAACGSDEADEREVRRTVEGLYEGIAAKDAKKVCSLLSKEGKEELTRNAPTGDKGSSCETVFGLTFTFGGQGIEDARDAKVTDVEVEGDEAKATVEYRSEEGDVGLVEEGGEWKLSGLELN
jgi:hypothetical protein